MTKRCAPQIVGWVRSQTVTKHGSANDAVGLRAVALDQPTAWNSSPPHKGEGVASSDAE